MARKTRKEILKQYLSNELMEEFKKYVLDKIGVHGALIILRATTEVYSTKGIAISFGTIKRNLLQEINDSLKPYLLQSDYERLVDYVLDTTNWAVDTTHRIITQGGKYETF